MSELTIVAGCDLVAAMPEPIIELTVAVDGRSLWAKGESGYYHRVGLLSVEPNQALAEQPPAP